MPDQKNNYLQSLIKIRKLRITEESLIKQLQTIIQTVKNKIDLIQEAFKQFPWINSVDFSNIGDNTEVEINMNGHLLTIDKLSRDVTSIDQY